MPEVTLTPSLSKQTGDVVFLVGIDGVHKKLLMNTDQLASLVRQAERALNRNDRTR